MEHPALEWEVGIPSSPQLLPQTLVPLRVHDDTCPSVSREGFSWPTSCSTTSIQSQTACDEGWSGTGPGRRIASGKEGDRGNGAKGQRQKSWGMDSCRVSVELSLQGTQPLRVTEYRLLAPTVRSVCGRSKTASGEIAQRAPT